MEEIHVVFFYRSVVFTLRAFWRVQSIKNVCERPPTIIKLLIEGRKKENENGNIDYNSTIAVVAYIYYMFFSTLVFDGNVGHSFVHRLLSKWWGHDLPNTYLFDIQHFQEGNIFPCLSAVVWVRKFNEPIRRWRRDVLNKKKIHQIEYKSSTEVWQT